MMMFFVRMMSYLCFDEIKIVLNKKGSYWNCAHTVSLAVIKTNYINIVAAHSQPASYWFISDYLFGFRKLACLIDSYFVRIFPSFIHTYEYCWSEFTFSTKVLFALKCFNHRICRISKWKENQQFWWKSMENRCDSVVPFASMLDISGFYLN